MVRSALVVVLALTGCQTAVQPTPISDVRAVWCEVEEPWTETSENLRTYSRPAIERFVLHNERGEKWCKWKPPT